MIDTTQVITNWERFLDSFDSSGGHIVLLLVLLLIGAALHRTGIAKGEDVMIGAFGALLGALRTTHSNHTRQNGAPKETT